MKAWHAWSPIAGVGALTALAGSAALLSAAARAWLARWLWDPIVHDLGYNPVNTLVLILLAAAGAAWLAMLFRHYGEEVDLRAAVGGLLFFFWGVTLRIFEDADLFAPFAGELRDAGATAGSACLPHPASFADCAGVLFITPLLWIWVAMAMFAFARLGLHVQWIGDRSGQGAAQWRARTVLAGAALLVSLPWLLHPAWMAATSNPVAPGLAALVAALALRRVPRLHWTHVLTSTGIILLAASASLVTTWFMGGSGGWAPHDALRPQLLLWCGAGIALVVALRWATARRLARGPARPADAPAGAGPWLQLYLDVATTAIVLAAVAGAVLWQEGRVGPAAMWPVLLLVLVPPAARRLGQRWGDARMAVFASGAGLLAFGGQAADAIVTGVGIDVLGAGEKHVVPRLLIGWVESLGLPAPLSSFPAAIVLIGLKLPLVVFATWMLGVRAEGWWPGVRNVRRLVLLAVGFVGAAPALRNLVRMSMGV